MLKRLRLTHTLALLAFAGTLNAQHSNHDHSRDHRQYEFIPNKGQDPSTINYSVKLVGGKMFVEDKSLLFYFTDNSALLKAHYFQQNAGTQIKRHAYRMTWVNAQKPVYNEQLKTKHYYNFFKGKVRSKWAGEVHAYNALGLKQLYPGISLKFETNANEKLEYTYTVAPGASPLQIIQQYDGVKVSLARNGDLLLETSISVNQELKPVAWQMINGKKVNVACRFKLHNNRVTFDFPKGYDEAYELIIDPVLIFGSYSGSTADNFGMTATYDYEGNLYSGGTCFDMGFPTTTGAYDSTSNPDASATGGAGYGVTDVVITKYSSDGSTLIYSTYLGGGTSLTGTETVHSLIVNNNNELMCFGATSSTDFPVTATAYDTSFNGGSTAQYYYNGVYFTGTGTDIYVAKFNLAGSNLLGCTFVGGSANDGVNYKVTSGTYSSVAAYDSLTSNYGDQFRGEIMTDAIGNIYIASTTRSSDFPTMNAFQPTKNGSSDAVVFKLDPTLTTLLFSTFLGGSGLDAGYSVKLDNSGNVFIAGGTGSNDFPVTAGTHHDTYQGGKTDGFIVKMSPSGSSMVAGSYVGTNLYDQTMFVEIDKEDNVYLYGNTLGMASWPITPGVYSNANSGQYILKLDSNLVTTIFSTLFGNSGGTVNISPSAFLVDVCGNIYVSGWGANILLSTPLSGMPVTSDAYLGTSPNGYDFYLACFQRDMQGLLYATYFGGGTSHEHVDGGTSRFDKYGIIYQSVCAGCCVQVGATVVCSNDDFPTTPGAWSNTNNSSNCNNGVFKFDFEIAPVADFVTDQFEGCNPLTINFTNSSPPDLDWLWDFGNGDTSSVIYSPTITYSDTGTYFVTLITEDSICGLIDTAVKIIHVYPSTVVSTASDTALCTGAPLTFTANSSGTTTGYVWSSSATWADTLNSPLTNGTINTNVTGDTTFYVQTFNSWCNDVDTITIDIQELDPVINTTIVSCAGDSLILTVVNSVPETYTIDWSPNSEIVSGDGTPSILIIPTDTTVYSVLLTSSIGCTATATVTIDPATSGLASVVATASPYDITAGESSNLTAVPNLTGYTYTWTPIIGLSDPTSATPVATPSVTTVYMVTVSQGGCSRTDTVIVRVHEFECGDPYIYVPNAFTPNGDNNNDVMFVRGRNITEVYFAIFERWGEKVFETMDMNLGWDGKVNGRDADPAVFDYYLKVKCLDGQEFFQKGNITLIR